MVISASLQACGVFFPLAMLTSICRSIVTICSGLYLLIGMSSFSSKWILSHSTWYKFRRSGHLVDASFVKSQYQEAVSTLNQAYIYYDLITDYFSRFVQSKNLLEVSCRWPNERISEGSG
jgi:hypothetical protein